MRAVRNALLLVGVLAGFTLGPCLIFVAWHLEQILVVAKTTPQAMTVGELVDKGPGDNLHLELTDVAWGKPIPEGNAGQWVCVWLPVHSRRGGTRSDRPVLFRTALVRTQAQLDALLKKPKPTFLATSPLPSGSLWKIGPSPALLEAYPKLDPAKANFLTDPQFIVAGQSLLGEQTLFDPSTAWVALGLGLGLLVLGVGCLLPTILSGVRNRLTRPVRLSPRLREQPLMGAQDRDRLAVENPLSVHRFKFWDCFFRVSSYLGGGALCVVVGVGCLIGAIYTVEEAQLLVTGLLGLVGLVALLCAWYIGWHSYQMATAGVAEIAVCHSGLRWVRHGKPQQATWGEIAAVDFKNAVVRDKYGARTDQIGTFTIVFRSGATLTFWNDTLYDFYKFSHLVATMHHEAGQLGR